MGTLYIIARSPYARKDGYTSLKLAQKGDGVIFIQDAVVATERAPEDFGMLMKEKKNKGVNFYVLRPDLKARAISTDIQTVSYEGFVDLIINYSRVVN